MPTHRPVQAHQRVRERDDRGRVRRGGSHRRPTGGSKRGRRTPSASSAHHSPVSTSGPANRGVRPGPSSTSRPVSDTPPEPVVLYYPAATNPSSRGSAYSLCALITGSHVLCCQL